jgi:hypothetical protein
MNPQDEETIPGALDAIRKEQHRTEVRLTALEQAVEDNTQLTREIRDAVTAGRVATKVVKWLGGLAIALSALYALYYQLTHDGRLPHQ